MEAKEWIVTSKYIDESFLWATGLGSPCREFWSQGRMIGVCTLGKSKDVVEQRGSFIAPSLELGEVALKTLQYC